MKRVLLIILTILIVFGLCACDDGSKAIEEAFNSAIEQAETLAANAKMEEAYTILGDVKSLDLTEEQLEKVKSYRNTILQMCFPGTFIVKPEIVTEVDVKNVSGNWKIRDLIANEHGGVWFTYEFEKISEKNLAAQQFRNALEQQYEFMDINAAKGGGAMHYEYVDAKGSALTVTVYDDDADTKSVRTWFNVVIDHDLYNLDLIDTSDQSKSLLDTSIIIME